MTRQTRRRSEWVLTAQRAMGSGRGIVGLSLVVFVALVAIIGPLLVPYSPTQVVTFPYQVPSEEFLLGGDVLGRDVLSRTLAGGRTLLAMAALATVLSLAVGTVLGVSAAYFRGLVDSIVMRIGDVLLAFPQVVLALLLVSVVGPRWWLTVLSIVAAYSPQVARVMRAAALDVAERDFVRVAEAIGTPRRTVIRREILPNLATPLMVELGLRLTYSIIFIAALSFLGLGQQPPAPDWGVMINENRLGLPVNPWALVVPTALIAVLTVGANLFTDAFARGGMRLGSDPSRRRAIRRRGAVEKAVADHA